VTHVAGIVAARHDRRDMAGAAPEATLYAVEVLDGSGRRRGVAPARAGGRNACRSDRGPIRADTASHFTTDGRLQAATAIAPAETGRIGVTITAQGAEREDVSQGRAHVAAVAALMWRRRPCSGWSCTPRRAGGALEGGRAGREYTGRRGGHDLGGAHPRRRATRAPPGLCMTSGIIRCPHCGTANRVPAEKAHLRARCGRCGAVLSVPTGSPRIVTDATFDADVLRSALPVLLDCWAPWCEPCRVLAPVIDRLAVAHAGRALVGKLNVDENPAVAARYDVRSIPTLLLFAGGQVVDRIVGVQSGPAIEARLQRLLA
jgi:thioredoxin 2